MLESTAPAAFWLQDPRTARIHPHRAPPLLRRAGLWLFSRKPVASPEAIGKMHALLKAKGVARSRLHKVEQEGCTYHGFNMK